ncbi:MAG: hypothetical protein IJD94_09305 [Clostridia bacterium]|nr:hypothetical protein [Clostridia bacterium]
MKLYSQESFQQNAQDKKRELIRMMIFALPCLAVAVAGFALRIEPLCTAGVILCGAVIIFLYDAKLGPQVRYGRYLKEAHSGLSRKTLGTLVRIGSDPVYTDGVNFREIILNIYEDMSEEGERRFLLDWRREMPAEWLDQDIIVTSHGSYLLEMELAAEAKA